MLYVMIQTCSRVMFLAANIVLLSDTLPSSWPWSLTLSLVFLFFPPNLAWERSLAQWPWALTQTRKLSQETLQLLQIVKSLRAKECDQLDSSPSFRVAKLLLHKYMWKEWTMDIFYNTRCSTSIVNKLLCTVFKDKFIFVRDMKHSLTLVFGTVFIGWNQMQIFDNDKFSIMPKYIFFDNDNLPISFKNADISAIDNFSDYIAHPY